MSGAGPAGLPAAATGRAERPKEPPPEARWGRRPVGSWLSLILRAVSFGRFAQPVAGPRNQTEPGPPVVTTLAVWAAIAILLAWRFAGKATDDIYVTYRYAWNLAHGLGFTFNPGEKVFGLTDPGVGLLLALVHRLTGLPIPLLGTLLSGLALYGIAALLLQESAERGRLPEGIAGGTLVLTSPYLWTAQGSGPLFALLLLLASARLAGRRDLGSRREVPAGIVAGLAFWCRPDAALGVALLGLLGFLLGSERRRLPWAWAAAAGAVMLAGCAAAFAAFGTLLPNTLAAKRAYAAFEPATRMGVAFWRSALELWRGYEGHGARLLLVLGILGLVPLLSKGGRAGRLLVLNGLALAAAYTLLRVPFFLWYTVPAAVAVLVGAPFAVGAAVRFLAARERLRPLALAGAIVGILLLALPLWGTWYWFRGGAAGDWRLAAYSRAGEWIRDHSAPGDDVALEEIGILGYTSRRPVSDLMGLVTPRAVPYAAEGDLIGAFLARPTAFLVFHTFTWRGGTRPIVTRPWFAAAYEVAAHFDLPEEGGSITVYRRRPAAKIPPPRPPHAHRPEAPV